MTLYYEDSYEIEITNPFNSYADLSNAAYSPYKAFSKNSTISPTSYTLEDFVNFGTCDIASCKINALASIDGTATIDIELEYSI